MFVSFTNCVLAPCICLYPGQIITGQLLRNKLQLLLGCSLTEVCQVEILLLRPFLHKHV